MIVCIDTNVLLQSRAASHPWHPILRACTLGRLTWAVSNHILTEYREMITIMNGTAAWGRMSQLLDLIAASGGLLMVTPHFHFGIVSGDPDDNAFTDCAITAGADYLITSDRDFAPLAGAGYRPQPISPEAFLSQHGYAL